MYEIEVSVSTDKVSIESPYNVLFVEGAKKLGGIWRSPAWVFDARDEARARDLLQRVYGTDGSTSPDWVTLRVRWPAGQSVKKDSIVVGGRVVARARSRDSGATLGVGVVLLGGGFDSGGSIGNWRTEAEPDTEFLLRDFPRLLGESYVKRSGGGAIYSIEPEAMSIDVRRERLEAEQMRLAARLQDIELELAELK